MKNGPWKINSIKSSGKFVHYPVWFLNWMPKMGCDSGDLQAQILSNPTSDATGLPRPGLQVNHTIKRLIRKNRLWIKITIDPLLFMFISKSPKTRSQNIAIFSKVNSTFNFAFITRGCHSYHKASCHAKVPISVSLWCFNHKGV